jgi:hypothetical protein
VAEIIGLLHFQPFTRPFPLPHYCGNGFSVDYTKMRKWKWLFVNSWEGKGPIYTATKFLKSCQDGKNTSVYLEILHR